MRKLQYALLTLSALCFAIPVFADGGSPAVNLAPIGIGLGIGNVATLPQADEVVPVARQHHAQTLGAQRRREF